MNKIQSRIISAQGMKPKNGKVKGIWMWDASVIASRPDDALNKCSQSHITEIYVPYDTAKASIAQYQYFIDKASTLGIDIHALNGDATWALTSGQSNGLTFIDNVNTYNSQSLPRARFKAVHFDVEPHALNGTGGYPNNWNTDKVGTIDQWITNSDAWIARAKGYGLAVGGAFVFWLDDPASAPIPARFGTKKVSEILIDRYDYYAIMAYDDTPANSVADANTEVNYATSAKVITAIEIGPTTPTTTTFYEEGFVAADNALKYIDNAFQGKAGYRGVAIHDFANWERTFARYVTKSPVRTLVPTRKQLAN